MADQQVKVILQGEDRTGPAFRSAAGGVQSMQVSVGTLLKTIGAVAAARAAFNFAEELVTGAAAAEASVARVTATLTAMGDAALENKGAILQASQAAVRLGFDDEAAAESITRFYQATGDLTEAQNLNAVAMDLARAKSLDLGTATNLVNQVLSGNGRVLKQYQIDISETASPLEALGQLHEQVKGQAEAFANTFEGRMATLKESTDNLKDSVGAALIEAITPFVKELADWAQDPAVQAKIKDIAKLIGDFAKVVIPIVIEAVKIMAGWFTTWYNSLVDIETIIFRVVNAINSFIAASAKIGGKVLNTITGGLAGGRAEGGPVNVGQTYLVGERGPELFTAGASGFITPNGALSGGGGMTVIVNYPMLLDDSMINQLGQKIMRAVGTDLRY